MLETTSYTAGPRQRAKVRLCAGLFCAVPASCLVGGLVTTTEALVAISLLVACITLPAAAYLFRWFRKLRLSISSYGIQVQGNSQPERWIAWQEIEKVSMTPHAEGLIVSQAIAPASELSQLQYAGAPLMHPAAQTYARQGRFVDLKPFRESLTDTTFLKLLHLYAPHLDLTPAAPAPRVPNANAKLFWIITLGTIAMSLIGYAGYTSTESNAFTDLFEVSFSLLLAVILLIYAVKNAVASVQRLRAQQFGFALLWILMSLVQAGAGVMFLSSGLGL